MGDKPGFVADGDRYAGYSHLPIEPRPVSAGSSLAARLRAHSPSSSRLTPARFLSDMYRANSYCSVLVVTNVPVRREEVGFAVPLV